jgi:hypothetical protein
LAGIRTYDDCRGADFGEKRKEEEEGNGRRCNRTCTQHARKSSEENRGWGKRKRLVEMRRFRDTMIADSSPPDRGGAPVRFRKLILPLSIVPSILVALFLVERTKEIRDAALEKDNLGIYALYVSLRKDICELLSAPYYRMAFQDIARAYLGFEPAIIAASQLCGFLKPPELADIPDLYKKRLVGLVREAAQPAGSTYTS